MKNADQVLVLPCIWNAGIIVTGDADTNAGHVEENLMRSFARASWVVGVLSVMLAADAQSQATVFQNITLREIITGSPIAGRDGIISAYIFPGSPYPFGNLGAGFAVGEVCAPGFDPNQGGVWLSAGQGFGDMIALTPTGSPFLLGQVDPSGKTELCNPQDTDDTWWFGYGNSLNLSPLLAGRFFGNDDELQIPSCSSVPTPEEGILFLERRSADRQGSDLSCQNIDVNFPLRVGTVLICSFRNTWLNAAGQNLQPVLESCERYLACSNVPFGPVVARGLGCAQPSTPPTTPLPTNPPVIACSTQTRNGGDAPETHQVELARTSGTFQFDYNTFTQKDQIRVSYQGQVLLDTGCVGQAATHHLNYIGNSTRVTVEVFPNCEGGSQTDWGWVTYCPQ
jgi:hypothetical protein